MARYNGVKGIKVILVTNKEDQDTVLGKQQAGADENNEVTDTKITSEVGKLKHLFADGVLRKHFITLCFIW